MRFLCITLWIWGYETSWNDAGYFPIFYSRKGKSADGEFFFILQVFKCESSMEYGIGTEGSKIHEAGHGGDNLRILDWVDV